MPISKIKQNSIETDITPIGVGQTWQYVTGSRAIGTTYTNTTGRPIMVALTIYGVSGGASGYLYVNSFIVGFTAQVAAGAYTGAMYVIVPAGATYSVVQNIGTIQLNTWVELR